MRQRRDAGLWSLNPELERSVVAVLVDCGLVRWMDRH